MSARQPLFASLEPPTGGQARLLRALEHRQRRTARGRQWSLAAATASVVVLVLLTLPLRQVREDKQLAKEVARTVTEAWSAPVADLTVANGAAEPVLRTDEVRLYWVATQEAGATQ